MDLPKYSKNNNSPSSLIRKLHRYSNLLERLGGLMGGLLKNSVGF